MRGLRLFALAVSLTISGVAAAKPKVSRDFQFPQDRPVRIIVLRPDVEVGSIGIGGVEELNADWTEAARKNLALQIEVQQRARNNDIIFLPEQEGERGKLVADYQALFRTVASAAAEHQINSGFRLLTRGEGLLVWTLGPGASRLAGIGGGDYALLVKTHDAFGTGGRKAFRLLTGGLMAAVLHGSGVHRSNAALVDLKSGDLVWFTVDPGSGGDPRTDAGASKRMGQLFGGFPAKTATNKVAAR